MSAAPSRWFRANLWIHRWTGLVATLPFLVLCVTGIAEWLVPRPRRPAGRSADRLLVAASRISGLVIYAPYMKKVAYGVIRRGRGARLTQLDLHNVIGAVVLGWALVVSGTGPSGRRTP